MIVPLKVENTDAGTNRVTVSQVSLSKDGDDEETSEEGGLADRKDRVTAKTRGRVG